MKILHTVHGYPPWNIGGTELYTRNLAICQSRRPDTEVSVISAMDSRATGPAKVPVDEKTRLDGVEIYFYPRSRGSNLINTCSDPDADRWLEQRLREISPDMVHVQHLIGLSGGFLRCFEKMEIPFVVTLHDFYFICHRIFLLNRDRKACPGPAGGVRCAADTDWDILDDSSPASPWDRTIDRLACATLHTSRHRFLVDGLNCASRIIVPSSFMIDLFRSSGVVTPSYTLLEHGIDPEPFLGLEPTSARELRIAYIGAISRTKGLHVLLEAAARLGDLPFRLDIHGRPDPNDRSYAEEQKRKIDGEKIVYHGPFPDGDIPKILGSADVLVVPSLYPETFSIVSREAYLAGVPVIASRIGALTEAVRDGRSGLLFEPGNADELGRLLKTLTTDRRRLEELKKGIPEVMTLDQHADRLMDIYEEVLKTARNQGQRPPRPSRV